MPINSSPEFRRFTKVSDLREFQNTAGPAKTPLFSFAIIADTHIMPETGPDTAPYAVLRKANQRVRLALKDLRTRQPQFVIHLGDMVRPFPALPNYDEVCELALDIFREIPCPVHYLPGNHDIGDKPIASAPAPRVCNEFVAKYKFHFGRTYHAFEHGGIHFITLNASVINSGLKEEAEQWAWLQEFTVSHLGERCFLFIHYPPYLALRDELPHYDNIDEPGRTKLLDLIACLSVEGLFAGHVHHFFYNRSGQTNMYCLPSTAFTRHDFSELFTIAPGAEFGRDDVDKLGYAMVDVFADGHAVRLIHPETQNAPISADAQFVKPLHPSEGLYPPVAVQMRHDWSALMALPTNGPLDEFTRKKVRNDYPILATWQIGISWLRVPIEEVLSPQSRERMCALQAMGQKFVGMVFGVPDKTTLEKLNAHSAQIDVLEVILSSDETATAAQSLASLRRQFAKPIYLGVLESSAQATDPKTKFFAHKTSIGFHPNSFTQPDCRTDQKDHDLQLADGLVFYISSEENVLTQIAAIEALSQKLRKPVIIHLSAAGPHPAHQQFDSVLLANRTALACIGAYSLSKGLVVFDTLMDIDRGDFPRSGLIDRRGNMNLSGRYLKTLLAVLGRNGPERHLVIDYISETQTHTFVRFQQNARPFGLYLRHEGQGGGFECVQNEFGFFHECIDLRTGERSTSCHIGGDLSGLLLAL
jgi:predicted phosphodiesterase